MTVVQSAPIFDDLLDVRAFVEVAANHSFSKAARRLGEPRATISRRITRLEDRARMRLFERTTRSVQITDAGTLLLEHARRMLEEMEGARTSLERLSAAPSGRLRITAPIILGQALLTPIIVDFMDRFPECRPSLSLINAPLDLVADGYDAAFRVGPLGDSSMIARRLGRVEAALYAAPQLGVAAAVPADLEGLPVLQLGMEEVASSSLTLTDRDGATSATPVETRLQSSDPGALLGAALCGCGIAVLPTFTAAPHAREGTLARVLPDYAVRRSDVHVLIPSRRHLRPAVRAFVDFAAGRMSMLLDSR